MIIKIILDMLTQDSVSVVKQNVIDIEGVEYPIGETWRGLYVNSEQGRQLLQEEVSEPYKTAIFAVWGDTPTIQESIV